MYVKRAVPWMFVAAAIAVSPLAANAGVYPTNKCVSAKQGAAAKSCQAVLKAWSKWEKDQDVGKRDLAIQKASDKLDQAWAKADAGAAAKNAACDTVTSGDVQSDIETTGSDFITALNTGLTLGDEDHAKCGSSIAKAGASKCAAFLKAESKFVKKPSADAATKRDTAQTKASDKFAAAYTKATTANCPTAASEAALEGFVDTVVDGIVFDTTVGPSVDDTQVTTITHPVGDVVSYNGNDLRPICSKTTPYSYFVKRGTENKLLMYYQGGGACWDFLTCGLIGTFDMDVDINGTCTGGTNSGEACGLLSDCPDQGPGTSCSSTDNPGNTNVGLGDQNNPLNPFASWNIVFVSYCTGDIHFGDSEQFYSGGGLGSVHIEHRGYVNAQVAEKFAREHFPSPDEVFVTGSSAGAYGAFFNAPLLREIYPAAKFNVLGDAGNGVVTQQFLDEKFPVWNFAANLPTNIPGLAATLTDGSGIPGYTEIIANHYSTANWAHYTTAFDGGTGGQTGFYNVMLNPTTSPAVAAAEWPTWWEASCEWNDVMKDQAVDTAAAVSSNYRYYIGSGSRHTMFGSNKVYTDTTGGVPTIVDWINAMRNSIPGSPPDPLWTNVLTSDEGILLAGDPRENGAPPPDPFVDTNADNVADRIVCP